MFSRGAEGGEGEVGLAKAPDCPLVCVALGQMWKRGYRDMEGGCGAELPLSHPWAPVQS